MKSTENEKLYYSIGEVSKILEIPASTLRFWEKEFRSVKPYKNKRGERFYLNSDIEELKKIHHLTKEKGFTLSGAKEQLKKNESANDNQEIIKKLKPIKEKLLMLRSIVEQTENSSKQSNGLLF